MKKILFLLMILSFNSFAVTPIYMMAKTLEDQILERLEVQNFVKGIVKIKSYKRQEQIREVDYKLRPFYVNANYWFLFDERQYYVKLREKISKTLTKEEKVEIFEFFSKPFYLKIINSFVLNRDLFLYRYNSISTDYKPGEIGSEKRREVLEKFYKFHQMDIIKDNLVTRLNKVNESDPGSVRLLESRTPSGSILIKKAEVDKRIKEVKEFLLRDLNQTLIALNTSEIIEYLRNLKTPAIQKAVQLYSNYHFLYFNRFLNSLEADKARHEDAIKIRER